jgi:seryl-tRNA(Sec) selenium transferase
MTERAKTTLFDGTAKIHVGFGTIEVVWSDKGGFADWCLRAGVRLRECGINDGHEQQTRAVLNTKISHGLTILTEHSPYSLSSDLLDVRQLPHLVE